MLAVFACSCGGRVSCIVQARCLDSWPTSSPWCCAVFLLLQSCVVARWPSLTIPEVNIAYPKKGKESASTIRMIANISSDTKEIPVLKLGRGTSSGRLWEICGRRKRWLWHDKGCGGSLGDSGEARVMEWLRHGYDLFLFGIAGTKYGVVVCRLVNNLLLCCSFCFASLVAYYVERYTSWLYRLQIFYFDEYTCW